jgi:SRSO17 transposase
MITTTLIRPLGSKIATNLAGLPIDARATKLAIGADLAVRAREAGFVFRAVAADSAYGDQDGFRGELARPGCRS